jgi:hypothetical protein
MDRIAGHRISRSRRRYNLRLNAVSLMKNKYVRFKI